MDANTYYRLQSNRYEVGPGSISWYMEFSTIEEAMENDILGAWRLTDNRKFYNEQIKRLKDGVPIREVWQEFIDAGNKSKWVEPGLSSFSNVGKLFIYWRFISPSPDDIDDPYLLVFIGEYIGVGSDGEDCVKFVKEVERRSLEDCLPITELLVNLDHEVHEYIRENGFNGIDELIKAADLYLTIYNDGRLGEYELEKGFLRALEDD